MPSPWPQLRSAWKSPDEVLLLAQLAGLEAGFADVVMTRRDLQVTIHCKSERWDSKNSKNPKSDCTAELLVLESAGKGQDWLVFTHQTTLSESDMLLYDGDVEGAQNEVRRWAREGVRLFGVGGVGSELVEWEWGGPGARKEVGRVKVRLCASVAGGKGS